MRVLVFGGRDYGDRQRVFRALDALHAKHGVSLVIHGGARGADSLGGQWAQERWVPVKVFMADWSTHGKRAGPLRNQQMLDEGKLDSAVGFPGGVGTADMARRLAKAGVKAWFPDQKASQ